MRKTKIGLSQVIESIYATPLENRGWDPLANLLAKATNSFSSTLVLLETKVGAATALGVTENYTSSVIRAYEEYYHQTDVWAQRAPFVLGQVLVSDDIISRHELEASEFYNDWIRPIGITNVMGSFLPVANDLRGIFAVHRGKGEKEFSSRDRLLSSLLNPHLTQAIRLSSRIHSLSLGLEASLQGLTTTDLGMVVVDASAKIIFYNNIGNRLLASKIGLLVKSGRLYAEDVKQNELLQKAVTNAANAAVGRSLHPGGHMTLWQRNGMPTSILITPLRPENCATDSRHPKAVIFITDPHKRRRVVLSAVSQYYGFTPSEARLTAAIAEGEKLQDYADRLELSLHTVKTQLKSIFLKAGVTRQSDLIRDILTNPLLCG